MSALPLSRLQGTVDGIDFPFPVLNDVLLAQKNPAATARYLVRIDKGYVDQKSSGIWVCTAAGSTAAMASAGGRIQDLSDSRLQIWIREPCRNPVEEKHFGNRYIEAKESIEIISKMREGVLYLDGPHQRIAFSVGSRVVLRPGAPSLQAIVTKAMQERRLRLVAKMEDGLALNHG